MPEQLEFFDIPSPCQGICQADERGFCRGCMRNRDERFRWMYMSNAEKRETLRLCCQRYLRYRRIVAEVEEELPRQPSLF